MNLGFWKKLKESSIKENRPIIVLAPMADVTDASFRHVIAKYGKPDAMWTEFVSADGLIRATEDGKKKLLKDLMYSEEERPIVAQLFSGNPEYMKKASVLCRELGFDGIDINMGCPDKSIEKQGAGASMMKDYKRAREVLRSAKEGAGDLPVSVKTRIGYNKDELDTWLPELLAEEPSVVTIHARTRKEMSKVPARWEEVRRAVEIRDSLKSKTLIFGNGDILDVEDAIKKGKESGADGVMLGRAIFGNPFLFANLARENRDSQIEHTERVKRVEVYTPSLKEKLRVLVEHTKLFEELLGDTKSFALMKKHFKSYLSGVALAKSDVFSFSGAHELRTKLMEAENVREVESIVNEFLVRVEKA